MSKCIYDKKPINPTCENLVDTVGAGKCCTHDCVIELNETIEKKDAEIARLVSIINSECNKCCDCAKFGGDCSAGDVEGNEDRRACEKFISKQIAAKDAEIADLKNKNSEAFKAVLKRDSLINELTKALEQRIDCSNGCDNCTMPTCTNQNNRRLIAKVREVMKNDANYGANAVSLAEENAKLRGLVSDLADRLRNNPCLNCGDDGFCTTCNDAKITDSLVDKAREVLGEDRCNP